MKENHSPPSSPSQEIIIIGSGISGLSAANNFLKNNYKVTILEARDRIGGRISTIELGDNKLDMGASWIHGIGPNMEKIKKYKGRLNPIFSIAKENNLQTIPTWADEEKTKISYYWYKLRGRQIQAGLIDDYIDRIEEYLLKKVKPSNTTQSYQQVLSSFKHGSHKYESLYKSIVNFMYIQDSAAELSEQSLIDFYAPWKFDGPEHIFQHGYTQIIEILSKDQTILLNKKVIEINYSQDKIIIHTNNGEVFTCDKVLITVPVSVLQSRVINFNPPLIDQKLQAIDKIGMGLMDKLWLEFNEVFWINDLHADWICYAGQEVGFWVNTLNYYKYTGKPILLMFISADAAKVASLWTDEEFVSSAMTALRDCYPNAPDCVQYRRSNWSQDEFSLGSYPYCKVGLTVQDFKDFKESRSTNDKVFFAGDGTAFPMIGCAHGAYISGVEVSDIMMGT
jgi:monoamine oxidase